MSDIIPLAPGTPLRLSPSPFLRMPVRTCPRSSPHRNVVLGDYHGHVLAGFYQYGAVSWQTFFKWLSHIFDTSDPWIIVMGDRLASEQYFPANAIVMPGKYTVLDSDWSPMRIKLVSTRARRQLNTLCRVKSGSVDRHSRARHRNCASSGGELSWCKLQAAHALSISRSAEVRMTVWACGYVFRACGYGPHKYARMHRWSHEYLDAQHLN